MNPAGAVREFRALTTNQRTLFWAQVAESFGAFGLVSAFTLWATTDAGGGPGGGARAARLVSWVIAANTLPRLLLAPAVARACRRWDETGILQSANLLRAVVCLAAVLLAHGRRETTAGVLAVVLALACLDQFFAPARAAAAQRNLRDHERVAYGALSYLALSGVGLVSAALTPRVFATGGLRAWLWIGAACSLVSMALLTLGYRSQRDLVARDVAPDDGAARPAGPDDEAGRRGGGTVALLRLAFTGSHDVARVSWSIVAWGLALGLTNQTMAPLAVRGLHVSVARYGWIPAAFAAGGLAAWLVTRAVSTRMSASATLTLGAMLLAAGYLAYGTAPASWWCVVAMLVAGLGFGMWSSVQGAILQRLVPNRAMAGYVAITSTLGLLATLAGSQAGRLAVHLSTRAAGAQHPMPGYRASYLLAVAAVAAAALLRGSAASEA